MSNKSEHFANHSRFQKSILELMDLCLLSLDNPPPYTHTFLFYFFYLFLGLEDIAAEDVALSVSGDVTENLQILGVMRHVEYPERRNEMGQQNTTRLQAWQHFLNVSSEAQQALRPFLWSSGTTKINTVF